MVRSALNANDANVSNSGLARIDLGREIAGLQEPLQARSSVAKVGLERISSSRLICAIAYRRLHATSYGSRLEIKVNCSQGRTRGDDSHDSSDKTIIASVLRILLLRNETDTDSSFRLERANEGTNR